MTVVPVPKIYEKAGKLKSKARSKSSKHTIAQAQCESNSADLTTSHSQVLWLQHRNAYLSPISMGMILLHMRRVLEYASEPIRVRGADFFNGNDCREGVMDDVTSVDISA